MVDNAKLKKRVVFDPEEGYVKTTDVSGATESELITEWVRDYRLGFRLAHVSGYLGEVKEDEVGKVSAKCPTKGPRKLGSLVGRGGLEEQYNCILVGIDGEELVEVDALGKRVRTLGRKEPIAGDDLTTSIDSGLQLKVVELFEGNTGAVVVSGKDNEILAFYSSPSFDPNSFIRGNYDEIDEILNDSALPIFNRVSGGTYPPGSTVKPLVAAAALEEKIIDEDYVYEDTGQILIQTDYGDFSYKNWYFTSAGGVEGKIGVEKAIARSTDTFFYKLGEMRGIDLLSEWLISFGLNEETGIDLPGEVSGLIPDPEWKLREKGEKWFLGNTYHMSIGQGDVSVTPLALNSAISSLAFGGTYCKPHFVSSEFDQNEKCVSLDLKEDNLKQVVDGMIAACSDGGTGYPFFDFKDRHGFDIACKTGTAQITGDKDGDTHAWFTAFAPADDPEIVITVLVERGGEGSYTAAPIAKEIFDHWFSTE